MNLCERLRALISALPSDSSSVTLTRGDLVQLLEGAPATDADELAKDLTVEQVGKLVGRAPSTIRGWLIAGQLRGYNLNGKSWRVPRSAVREFLDAQVRQSPAPAPVHRETNANRPSWRQVRGLEP